MSDGAVPATAGNTVESVLRGELAHGDALIGTIAPILRHLLANDDHSVFSDEIVARMRGMMAHVARQLLGEIAVASGTDAEAEPDAERLSDLTASFAAHSGFLPHLHALALEWQLTERLQRRLSLDPVLSPLLQALIASPQGDVAASAMALLAAQARFVQAQRRMELPLGELPGDLLHAALLALANHASETEAAAAAIRQRYDESRNRLGLLARLVAGMGGGASVALGVGHAGVALFLTALSLASGQDRDLAVLATNEGQLARLALSLRAAGLKPAGVEEQFLALHPEVSLPEGFETLGPDRAAALLALSGA